MKKVLCVRNSDGREIYNITIGYTYVVIEEDLKTCVVLNDSGSREKFDKKFFNFVKDDVLEVKISRINDNYSYAYIAYQDFEVIRRGKFCDDKIGVTSLSLPDYDEKSNRLYVCGSLTNKDDCPFIISSSSEHNLMEIVRLFNEKYRRDRKWRADKYDTYYSISRTGEIILECEIFSETDYKLYNLGNYFKTKKDAKNSKLYKLLQEMKDSN